MCLLLKMVLPTVVLSALLAVIAAGSLGTSRLDTRQATNAAEGARSPRRGSRATAEDGHMHDDETVDAMCGVSKMQFVQGFNEVSVKLNLTGVDGHICSLPVPECHHHDDEEDHHDDDEDHHDDEEEHDDHDDDGGSGSSNDSDRGCLAVYRVCEELVLHTNLVSATCLSDNCNEDENATSSGSDGRPSSAEAYGYGFLMVCFVSLGSLLGIFVVPLITGKDKNPRKTLIYKYTYFFMIALGTSALLCDAILHLLPHAWDLHAHEESEDTSHAHNNSHGKTTVEEFVWKGSIVLLALYLFYLLEFLLHGFTSHTHSHGFPTDTETDCNDGEKECIQLDASVPHRECGGTSSNGSILHPAATSSSSTSHNILRESPEPEKQPKTRGVVGRLRQIKPLAWLIIVGDGLHNFADGLALGAAISQSLTLGISTTIALVFHEIPHEFGDYVILLSTGLTWYSALLFNFISALTAVIGFFVGVAIGTRSEEVNGWVLAFAAGLFVYIALVDLLPELIHSKEKGPHRWGLFIAANIGFFLSFIALFLLAVYEEDLNTLIS